MEKNLQQFDTNEMQKDMRQTLLHLSYFDTMTESSYHNFFFGGLFSTLHDYKDVFVNSNKEAGSGRFDVIVEFRSLKKAICFEFKKSKSKKELQGDAKKD